MATGNVEALAQGQHWQRLPRVVGCGKEEMPPRKLPATDRTPAVITDIIAARRRRATSAPRAPEEPAGAGIGRAEALQDTLDAARQERLRELQARIEAGQYDPDPEEVARRLVEQGF